MQIGHVGHQSNQQQDHPQDDLVPWHAALTVVRMLFASIDLGSFRELAEDPVDSLLLSSSPPAETRENRVRDAILSEKHLFLGTQYDPLLEGSFSTLE